MSFNGTARNVRPPSDGVSYDALVRQHFRSTLPYWEQIYADSCAKCHGVDARGGGQLSGTTAVPPPALTGPSSHLSVHSDADLFGFISNGLPGGMPPWARTLSDEDIWNVINFLHSIQTSP